MVLQSKAVVSGKDKAARSCRAVTYGVAQRRASAVHSNASQALPLQASSEQGCHDELLLGRPVGCGQGR